MQVKFYATLRTIVGGKSVDFNLPPGTTVQELLNEMVRSYPDLERELLNDQGQLYSHVHIFVNGRDSTFLENGMNTALTLADTVGVFPAVGGG